MSKQDDRSESALRERLEIAGKATKGPWALWEWDNGVKEIRSHFDPDEAHVCRVWHKEDGEFLRDNSPREVQADIEEILRLRRVERYLAERLVISRPLSKTYYGGDYEAYATKEEAIQSWIDAARKAVEEGERNAE